MITTQKTSCNFMGKIIFIYLFIMILHDFYIFIIINSLRRHKKTSSKTWMVDGGQTFS